MRKGRTGRLALACAISLACHLLAFVALRSVRPVETPRSPPSVEVSLIREPEIERATPHTAPKATSPNSQPTQSPQTTPVAPSEVAAAAGPVVASNGPISPSAPPQTPAIVPAPPKLVFDCDELAPKASGAKQRCPPTRWARAGSKPGQSQVAYAHQAEFDAGHAQENGGPIVIGHLTIRPTPDKNSDPNLWGILKFSF